MKFYSLIIATFIFLFSGCTSSNHQLKIAATPVPHADILNEIKPDLAKEGIELKVIEVDDYNLPNRLLAEKQVDANFFQHEPFLVLQKKQFGYPLTVLAKVHIEPLGVYSDCINSLESIPDESCIAIPNDPTNEARALRLLEKEGLISLKNKTDLATTLDIDSNPKHLHFEEIDAPFLPRVLKDVDLAVIPSNFALQAHLNPSVDAIAIEAIDSPYANVIAIRSEDINRSDLKKLQEVIHSEKVRKYIEEKYQGAIVPAF